ncbi:MAG: SdiA-regulated domain-containing protein [Candidatus Aminicenantes bacterium]|nr:SdiA-regulated domain-containing protein [Candidatus Aminicenantes bacterium]MBL7083129.1 SdiA-regulated domain-containing protein [Candidatus Aminicenantes bacterium]
MKVTLILLCIFILLFFLFSCSPTRTSPTIRFPYDWIGPPGFGGNIDKQDFVEPSGICFHPLRKTLFVVSDEGEIAEIETDGTPVFNLKIPGDLEDVTVHPETGFLYLVREGEDVILEFDPDKKEVTREFPINREYQGDPNFLKKKVDEYDNGVESIAFILAPEHPEGGTFYMGNQWDPSCIMEVLVPLKSSKAKTAEARIIRVLPFIINDPAAIFYDSKTGLLNVVSDADNILVELTLDGKFIKEYAFPGDEQEGLARDDEGYLYIAQDLGGIIKIKDLR